MTTPILTTNIDDVVMRIATESKSLRTLLNGNSADNAALLTTAKGNLVAAINELKDGLDDLSAGAAGIDDTVVGTGTTYSSSKVMSEIGSASSADRNRANHSGTQSADTVVDGTNNKVFTAAEKTKLGGVATGATANASDANLRDRATHTGTQAAATISDFVTSVNALINAALVDIRGNAPAALDTLEELAAALDNNPDFVNTITTALANRVRFDAAQSLTGPQQTQARSNIGAADAAALATLTTNVGDTSTNFVATFEAGLT